MEVTYAFRWNERRSKPATPLTEQQARERDSRGDEYAALLQESGERCPTVVTVVWETDTVDVKFFDDPGRLRVNYRFRRMDERMLFLGTVTCYFYPTEDPGLGRSDSNRIEANHFDPEGLLTHTIRDDEAGETVTTKYQDIDVGRNWEPVPTFGDWASISRYER